MVSSTTATSGLRSRRPQTKGQKEGQEVTNTASPKINKNAAAKKNTKKSDIEEKDLREKLALLERRHEVN